MIVYIRGPLVGGVPGQSPLACDRGGRFRKARGVPIEGVQTLPRLTLPLFTIVAAAATSDQLADTLHEFMTRRMIQAESIVQRAVERGELGAGADARLIVESVVGPIWFRLLLTGETIDEDFVTALASLVRVGATNDGVIRT